MNKTFSVKEAISYGWNTFKNNWKFWVVVTLLVGIGRMGGGAGSIKNSTNNLDFNKYKQQLNTETMDFTTMEEGSSITERFENSVLGTATEEATKDLGTEKWPVGLMILTGIIAVIVGAFAFTFTVLTALAGIIFKMGHINLTLDAARGKEVYYKTLLNQVSFKKALRFLASVGLSGLAIAFGYILFIIPGILLTFKYMFVPYVVVDEDPGIFDALKRSSQITKGVRNKLFVYVLAMFGLSILGLLAFGIGIYVVTIIGSLSLAYIYITVLKQEKANTKTKSKPKKSKK